MKTIFNIARAELRNLFYSPVAWFLAIVFMIQCGFFYSALLEHFTRVQEFGMKMEDYDGSHFPLTMMFFLSESGVYASVISNLYLFIPLLTMGLLSREESSGSIKLLYSSPIKVRHILLGKYLSLMIFNLVLLTIVGIFMVSSIFHIQNVEYGMLLSASLGFYLLVGAYGAIGLFMSSLTTYQIVSAVGTFVTIFILSKIGGLWQEFDFVRDLTYFLSIAGRLEKMLVGLITTKDLFYFLIVIIMFLGFTILKLKSGRESKAWYIRLSKYLAIVICSVLLGYLTSRPALVGYLDVTANKNNTIQPNVQKIVKELNKGPLEVTLYVNIFARTFEYGKPSNRNNYLSEVWEQYQRFKTDIIFKYEYYYDLKPDSHMFKNFPDKNIHEIAKDYAIANNMNLSKFKTPEEMKKILDLESEDYSMVMQLKYNGRTEFLRTFISPIWPEQMQVAAAFKRLQNVKIPKVLFTTGNLERDLSIIGDRGYLHTTISKLSNGSLINTGFDVDTISLDRHDIPKGIDILVLADPKTELSPLKKQKIQQYIDSGGNLLILGEPGKGEILNSVTKPLGVQFDRGTLVQVLKDYTPNLVFFSGTESYGRLSDDGTLRKFMIEKPSDTLFFQMTTAMPILYSDSSSFNISPLLRTRNDVWLKKGRLIIDSIPPILNPAEGDYHIEPFVGAVSLSRKINNKEQRIIISGEADFMSNKTVYFGWHLSMAIFSWLDYNEFPIYINHPPHKDRYMKISTNTAMVHKTIYVWILPGLLTLLGIIILIRRKRK